MNGGDYVQVWQAWHLTRRDDAHVCRQANSANPVRMSTQRHVLQRARIEKHISLTELAKHVECDVKVLAAFERGEDIVSPKTLKAICSVLEVKL